MFSVVQSMMIPMHLRQTYFSECFSSVRKLSIEAFRQENQPKDLNRSENKHQQISLVIARFAISAFELYSIAKK